MRKYWLSGVSLAALLTCGGIAGAASGPPNYWQGNGGSWINGSWGFGAPPQTGDKISLTGTGPQSVTFDDDSNPTFAALTIDDASSTDTGMQLGTANSFGTAGGMTVGDAGIGQFAQTDGTTSFTLLTVGSQQGSAGTVNLTGGVMNDDAVIGDAGSGTYNNTGAIHNVSGSLILGNQPSGNGTYTLTTGGTLNVTGSATIGAAGTGSFTQGLADQSDADSGNSAIVSGSLALGDQLFSSGTVTINSGSLGVGGGITVGNLGLGVVNQTGGLVTGGSLTLGNSGSNVEPVDSYNLTGNGALVIYGNETVGELGNASFVQGNGTDYPTHMVGGTLIVGDGAAVVSDPNSPSDGNGSGPGPATPNPREGSFTLNSGSLEAGNLVVANQGIGSFTQNGGDVTVLNQLTIASQATIQLPDGDGNLVGGPSQGTYSLANGTLTTGGALTVGDAGNGVLNQTGGTLVVGFSSGPSDPDLTVGAQAGSTGNYSLSGGGSATVNGNLVIGRDGASGGNPAAIGTVTVGTAGASGDPTNLKVTDTIVVGSGGNGSLTQYSGSVAAPNVSIGGGGGVDGGGIYPDGGTGTYTMAGGTLATSLLEVGHAGTGTFTQTGGDVSASWTLWIGNAGFSNGTYNLSGGTLTTGGEQIGLFGSGSFNQSGGSNNSANAVWIGGGGGGTYTMTGGSLAANSVVGNPDPGIIVGNNGTGLFTQTAGWVTSGIAGMQRGDLVIGAQSGTTGTYNLGGATNGAPALQVYGDTTIGRDSGATGGLTIAGDGTTMNVNQFAGFDSHNGGNLLVGLNGAGAVTQTGASTVYLDHNLVLGANAGSSGSYTLNATPLDTGPANLFVGSDLNIGGMTSQTDVYGLNFQTTANGGSGTFNLQSGAVATAGAVNVGANDGTGNLNVSGGTLLVGNGMEVGVNDGNPGGSGGGTGTVTQTGGVVTIGDAGDGKALNLGLTTNPADTTTGTYALTGAASLTLYGSADLGVSAGATGSMTIGSGLDNPTVSILSTGNNDGNLTVGDAGTGNLTVNSGNLIVTGVLGVGVNGSGNVTQTGGNVSASYIDLSTPAGGGSGTYSLSGGLLHSLGDLNVGGGGTGPASFSQSGGSTANVDGTLRIGNANANASYTLDDGALNVGGDSYVGFGALSGSMTQNGGSHMVGGSLIVGDGAGSNGLYTLAGGTLTTGLTGGNNLGDAIIGYNGTGELDNSGGVQTSSSNNGFTLGWAGTGTYMLTGTGSLSVAANENIGVFGTGTFVQGDGSGTTSNTVGGSLLMSSGFGGPTSSYMLSDGALRVSGDAIVGFAANSLFTQTGGSTAVGGNLTLGLLSNIAVDPTQFGNGTYTLGGNGDLSVGGSVTLGSQAGTVGTFNFNTAAGDTATISNLGGRLVVGDAGSGTFNQGGGAFSAIGGLTVGQSTGGSGIYNLAGGSLTDDLIVGDAGTGTFNNSGGTHNVTGNLTLGNQASGNGTYNLSGGTLAASGDAVIGNAGTGAFNESAGAATMSGTMQIGATGTAALTGGTLSAAAIVNNNSLVLSSGTVIAPITNNATVTTAAGNAVTITGAATNNGMWSVSAGSTLNQSGGFANNTGSTLSVANSTATFGGGAAVNGAGATIQVSGSAITFSGGLTNNGAYISDPSINTFSSLTIGATGYINASAGDRYVMTDAAGFVNNSADPSSWNTMGATLEYAGTAVGSQALGLNANTGMGFSHQFDSSFGWQTLALDTGAIINLVGGSVASDNAFYVDSLTGLTISGLDVLNIDGNGFDIFYLASADPALGGLTYNLADGGYLIPIEAQVPPENTPEPGTMTLLASALAGLGWFRRRLSAKR